VLAQRRSGLHAHCFCDLIDAFAGRFQAPLCGEQSLMRQPLMGRCACLLAESPRELRIGILQRNSCGFCSHVGYRIHFWINPSPFINSRPFNYPFIIGVHQVGQILVRNYGVRYMMTQANYFGRMHFTLF